MFHVHAPTGSILLNVDDPFEIRNLIPQSKTIELPGLNFNVAVKHTADAARLLRNLGIAAPPPALSAYRWPGKYKPMNHQMDMVDFYAHNKRCFNLSEMGTGKTAATLWAADILITAKEVRKVLVLAPLSTLERVWQQDIFDVLMHRQCAVVHGSREKRKKALSSDVDFYLLNHDGVAIGEIFDILRKRKDIDLIIVDEGSMFRNASTDKYKALHKMIRSDQRVWWITGGPIPNAPTDAWAQAKIINPNGVPQFFGTFKRSTMTQVTQFKWVPRAGSEQIAYTALQPAVRFRKSECLDLPPVTTINHTAPLSQEQKTAFNAMKTFMQTEIAKNRQQITAVNAADKINKLRQILCGAIKSPEIGYTDYVTLPHAPRLKTLRSAIDMAAAKVIVVVPFKGIIQSLETELTRPADKTVAPLTVGVLNGDVTIGARNRIITDFKTTADPHVLLCHPKVMAHGLTLTEADMLIFYAPIYSNDEFQQVTERINRAGQTRKMTIVRIGAHPMEWAIYSMIDTRRISQENVLSLYTSIAIA